MSMRLFRCIPPFLPFPSLPLPYLVVCSVARQSRDRSRAVATPEFWGQIATYLSLVYKWTEEKHLVAETVLGYFKKLFNVTRAHFNPVGGCLVGTGKEREFFVDQGLDNSDGAAALKNLKNKK